MTFPRTDIDGAPSSKDEGAGAVTLWSLLSRLAGRRRTIAIGTFVGMVATLVIVLVLPNRYESSTKLMPPDSASSASSALMRVAALGSIPGGNLASDLFGVKSSGALFMGVLQSRSVQDRIVDRHRLKDVYKKDLQEDARLELARNTAISEDRKSGIITIKVTDREPARAAELARAYVQELNTVTATVNTSAAAREREFLESRLAAVKKDLDEASAQLSAFSSRNATGDLREQAKATFEAVARLQAELILAESELQSMRQIYAPGSARLRVAEARVGELNRQMKRLAGTGGPASASDDAERNFPSLRELPRLGVDYANLYRRARTLEIVLETLTKQYELSKVEEAKNTPSVRVLDEAQPPERKAWPPRALFLVLGTLVSLLLSIAWVFVGMAWEQTDENDPVRQMARFLREELMKAPPKRLAATGGSAAKDA